MGLLLIRDGDKETDGNGLSEVQTYKVKGVDVERELQGKVRLYDVVILVGKFYFICRFTFYNLLPLMISETLSHHRNRFFHTKDIKVLLNDDEKY